MDKNINNSFKDSFMENNNSNNNKNSNLYLCNLSPFITEEILKREFGIFGKIESIKISPPKAENIKHFIAFVNFNSAEAAENAINSKQNKLILGQPVKIKYGKKLATNNAFNITNNNNISISNNSDNFEKEKMAIDITNINDTFNFIILPPELNLSISGFCIPLTLYTISAS